MRQLVACCVVTIAGISSAAAGEYPGSPGSWAGIYYGTSIGGVWGDATTPVIGGSGGDGGNPAGGVAGGQAGYNWQSGRVVVGVEGDLALSSAGDSIGPGRPERYDITETGALRARLGYDFGGLLVYGAAGLAGADVKVFDDSETDSDTFWGWTVGGGVETRISSHLAVRADYRYADFGSETLSVDGNAVPLDISAHQFMVGFNYYLGEDAGPLSLLSFSRPAAPDWSGFYFGGVTGFTWADGAQDLIENDYDGGFKFNGWSGGVRAGADLQMGSFVYGVVADFSVSDLDDSGRALDERLDLERVGIDYLGTIRARAGATLGSTLLYATGGVAYAGLELYDDGYSETKPMWGWTVGGGVEAFISEHQTLSLEYLYADFGETTFLVDSGHRKADLTSNIIRAGVSHRF